MNARTVKKRLMANRSTGSIKRAALTVRVPMELLPRKGPLTPPDAVNGWFRAVGHLAYEGKLNETWPVLSNLSEALCWAKGCCAFICDGCLYVTYNVKWFQCYSKQRFCAAIARACREAQECEKTIRVLKRPRYPPEEEYDDATDLQGQG